MKKSAVLVFFTSCIWSINAAHAQTAVVTENKSQSLFSGANFYGSLQLRQSEIQFYNGSTRSKTNSLFSIAPGMGAKLLEDKVDTFFRVRYGKSNESEAVQSVEAFNETFIYLYKNDFITTGPYAYSEFDPSTGHYAGTNLGLDLTGNMSLDTSFGGLKLGAFVRPQVVLMSKSELEKNKISPKIPNDFALTDEAKEPFVRRDTAYRNEMEISVGYKPQFLSDTTLSMVVDFTQEFNPTYIIKDKDAKGPDDAKFDSYMRKDLTLTRVIASYNLTKQTKVDGELRKYSGGFWEYDIDSDKAVGDSELSSKRMESRLSLTTSFE